MPDQLSSDLASLKSRPQRAAEKAGARLASSSLCLLVLGAAGAGLSVRAAVSRSGRVQGRRWRSRK